MSFSALRSLEGRRMAHGTRLQLSSSWLWMPASREKKQNIGGYHKVAQAMVLETDVQNCVFALTNWCCPSSVILLCVFQCEEILPWTVDERDPR